jgi:transposase
MTVEGKTPVRYRVSFQQQVVRAIESGESLEVLQRRYGIKGGQSVEKWLCKFGKPHLLNKLVRLETMEEKARVKQLEDEIRKLALADAMLAQRSLEVVIGEANKR